MSAGLSRLAVPAAAALLFAAFLAAYLWSRSPARLGPDAVVERNAVALGSAPPVPPSPSPNDPPAGTLPPVAGPAAARSPAGGAPAAGPATTAPQPSFDVVRVDATGDAVIAGRAEPDANVALIRNGEVLARTKADASGAFAFVPPALPEGSHDLSLQSEGADGKAVGSSQNVTVVVEAGGRRAPLVTVAAPGRPSVVLSRPDDPPAAQAPGRSTPATPVRAPARIVTVESESAGRLYVSGTAPPGATLRLYLNDTLVAAGQASPEGRVAFAIEKGIVPGTYKVRVDEVEAASGRVLSRAEVPFAAPATGGRPQVLASAAGGVDPTSPRPPTGPSTGAGPNGTAGPSPTGPSAGPARVQARSGALPEAQRSGAPPVAVPPVAAPPSVTPPAVATPPEPGRIVVAEIGTASVTRGESLWSISKRIYGQGTRYTVIYGANSPQIRNPDLIFPGQVFVVPRH